MQKERKMEWMFEVNLIVPNHPNLYTLVPAVSARNNATTTATTTTTP
jgi:hypothetical protein